MLPEHKCGAVIFDRAIDEPDPVPVCVLVWLSRATVGSAAVQEWLALARRLALPCRVALEEPLDLPDDLFAGIQNYVVEAAFTQPEKEAFVWGVRMELFPEGL
jgi:hypothetical protein